MSGFETNSVERRALADHLSEAGELAIRLRMNDERDRADDPEIIEDIKRMIGAGKVMDRAIREAKSARDELDRLIAQSE